MERTLEALPSIFAFPGELSKVVSIILEHTDLTCCCRRTADSASVFQTKFLPNSQDR